MNVHFSNQVVTDLRSSRANWDFALPIRDLLNIALRNCGIFTPRRVMLCISSPMTRKEISNTLEAFNESLDQLKPIIERYCPELLS
jgi:glutamate-1-semialdehyde aminotransferase